MLSKRGLRSCSAFNAAAAAEDGYAEFCEIDDGHYVIMVIIIEDSDHVINVFIFALSTLSSPHSFSISSSYTASTAS